MIGQDPQLGALAPNGGPTQTHAIGLGSPALDAGNPGTPGSGGFTCEATDQRGTARPQPGGGRCDIGAFELVYVPTTTTTSTTTSSSTSTTSSTSTSSTSTSTSTSTSAVVPTSTPTTTAAPTTTTLATGPCGDVPLTPPSFASIDCRLAQLLADVNGATGLGTYQAKLAKNVTTARGRLSDGGTLCRESNVKKTKKRLQQAGKAMTQFVHRLNGNAAKKKLDGTLRQSLVDAATPIGVDLRTFRGTVACPQDAPPS